MCNLSPTAADEDAHRCAAQAGAREAAASGSHITAITVNGVPVAFTDSITVVVHLFLASDGDNVLTQ